MSPRMKILSPSTGDSWYKQVDSNTIHIKKKKSPRSHAKVYFGFPTRRKKQVYELEESIIFQYSPPLVFVCFFSL